MKDTLLIILIVILFIIFTKNFTEKFSIFHNKKNYDYNNNFAPYYKDHEYNYEKKYIIDSKPSNDLNYIITDNKNYEHNDYIYKKKLYNIFEINNNLKILFKISENISWSNWKNPDKCLFKIYNKFIKYINNILKENTINIVYSTFNKFKINNNNFKNILLNIDLLLYRIGKIYAKHINMIIYYNNDKYYIIYLDIIGNVNEYDILNNNFIKDVNIENNVSYINKKNEKITNCNSYCDNKIDITDEYVDNKIANILVNKINKPYYYKNDNKAIYENIKYNNNQSKIKKYFMNKINKYTNITPYNY